MFGWETSHDTSEKETTDDETTNGRNHHLLNVFNRRTFLKNTLASSFAASAGVPMSADMATAQQSDSGSLPIEWKNTYGGAKSDAAQSVVQADDGGFAFAGWKTPPTSDNRDFWLVKTGSDGDVEFEKVLGGDDHDAAQTVIQTDDSGFAVGGTINPDGASIVKTDSQGNIEFNKSYSPHGHIGGIVQTEDGGYAVDTGIVIRFGNEAFLKLDSAGEVVVENDNYFEDRVARLESLIQTDDGGFVLAGSLDLHEDSDPLFVKLDPDGQLDFFKEYVTDGAGRARSIVRTNDGGYAMVGGQGVRGDVESRSWFRKLDADANVVFKETFDDSSETEEAMSLVQTDDGGYAFVGYAGDGSSRDAWIRKLDADGNVEVVKFFSGDDLDEARSLAQTADGGFSIAGRTRSSGAGEDDAWLIKTEPIQHKSAILDPEIKPVQVVFDTGLGNDERLDLVTDKETAVLVYPGGENLPELSGEVTFTLLSEESDAVSSSDEVTLTADEYRQAANEDDQSAGFYELFSTASSTGDKDVRVQIETTDGNAQIAASNNTNSVPVTNRSSREMHLQYRKIYGLLTGYSTPSDSAHNILRLESNEFVRGTFPVADDKYTGESQLGIIGSFAQGDAGISKDLTNLDRLAWVSQRLGLPNARSVGSVATDYFNWHSQNSKEISSSSVGITMPSVDSVIVEVWNPTSTAHELGHQFGLHTSVEEYDIDGIDKTDGYWVSRKEYIEDLPSFMEDPPPISNRLDNWIDNKDGEFQVDFRDYDKIFEQMEDNKSSITSNVVSTNSDDDILYMMGLVYKDGSVDLSRWYLYEDGPLKSIEDGEYSVIIKDDAGNTISDQSFDLSFKLFASATKPVDSPFETDVSGFSFPIGYPPEARSVEITKNSETLIEVEPNIKLLHSAIDSIPKDGFKEEDGEDVAEDRREALHNKVDAIEKTLNQDKVRVAIRKLKKDLKPALKRWLKDGYETTSPDQLTKSEVIELVDDITDRLQETI